MSSNPPAPVPTAETPLGHAWALHRDGRNEQALAEFDRILKEHPTDIDATFGLGLVQRALGQNDAAIASFERTRQLLGRALEQDPDDDRWQMLQRMCDQRIEEITEDTLVHGVVTPDNAAGPIPGTQVAPAHPTRQDRVRPYQDFPSSTEITALIAAIVPLFVSIESVTTVDGVVTSYFDLVDVVGGAIAVLSALSVIRFFGDTRPEDRLKRYAVVIVALVLGVYLLLHGLGMVGV